MACFDRHHATWSRSIRCFMRPATQKTSTKSSICTFIELRCSPSTHHRFLPLSFVSSATSPSSSFVFPLSSSLTEVLFRLSVLSPCFCEYLWRSMDSICPTWFFCFGLKASTRSKRKRLTDQETNWSEWSKKIDYGGIGGQSWGRDLVSNEFSPLSILASAGPSGNYVGRSRVL